ncbi:MAG: hypothetical protein JWM73_1001 [Solirubrobacterales bacterium]|nr:hypothetical protein [Solirubrobacterales bacterium]
MRRLVLTVALAVLGVAGPANAVDVPNGPGAGVASGEVVFTQDGGVVFEVPTTTRVITVYRVAPAANEAQTLIRFRGPSLQAHLAAAGPGSGFLISTFTEGRVTRGCCFATRDHTSVTYYAVAGGPGTVLRHCEDDCYSSACGVGEQVLPPADDAAVLLGPNTPACPPIDPPATWSVHDLASGVETAVPNLPYWFEHLAGRFVSGSDYTNGTVIDWTTGETVLTVPHMQSHALLPDGSVLYTGGYGTSAPVMRMAPGDAAPAPTGATGSVLAAAGSHVLTASDEDPRSLMAWDGGTLLGSLDDVRGPTAFDGSRVAFLDQACLTTRVQIWHVADPALERLPDRCGQPRVAGPAKLANRTARLVLRCPAATAEGCMGTISLQRPWVGSERPFALRPGRQRSVVVAAHLSPRSCRTLQARHTWKVAIFVPTQGRLTEARQWTVRSAGTTCRGQARLKPRG